MAGRKSKLTKTLITNAVKLMEAGCYVNVACNELGIDESTWYRWLNEGEAGKQPQDQFYKAIKKATAQAELDIIKLWAKHFPKDWKAGATFLERRYPDRWGRRDRTKVEHSGTLKHEHSVEAREELKELLDQMEKRAGVTGNGAGD